MEKVVMCKLYYFDNKGKRYYFESKTDAQLVRFVAYKGYDKERLTISRFIVPVSHVKSVFVPESEIKNYHINHFDDLVYHASKKEKEAYEKEKMAE